MSKKEELLEIVTSIKKSTENRKQKYLQSAEELEVFHENLFNSKSVTVEELLQQRDESMQEYKQSLRVANLKIDYKAKEFEALGETMAQYDRIRIETLKNSFENYAKSIERLCRSFLISSNSISKIV